MSDVDQVVLVLLLLILVFMVKGEIFLPEETRKSGGQDYILGTRFIRKLRRSKRKDNKNTSGTEIVRVQVLLGGVIKLFLQLLFVFA